MICLYNYVEINLVFIAFNTDPSGLNRKRTKDKKLKMTKSAGCFSLHSFHTFYAKKIVEDKGLVAASPATKSTNLKTFHITFSLTLNNTVFVQ